MSPHQNDLDLQWGRKCLGLVSLGCVSFQQYICSRCRLEPMAFLRSVSCIHWHNTRFTHTLYTTTHTFREYVKHTLLLQWRLQCVNKRRVCVMFWLCDIQHPLSLQHTQTTCAPQTQQTSHGGLRQDRKKEHVNNGERKKSMHTQSPSGDCHNQFKKKKKTF